MSADNVTPIKAANTATSGAPPPPRRRRPTKPAIRMAFTEPPDGEEPDSLSVWQALISVCHAAEQMAIQDSDWEYRLGLASAASMLSRMLEYRLEVGPLQRAEEQ